MTEPNAPAPAQPPVNPTRRERLRPLELIGFAAVLAVFAGLIMMLVLRTPDGYVDFVRAGIVAGSIFILVLLVLALLGLGGKPSKEDLEARKDLQNPGTENWH